MKDRRMLPGHNEKLLRGNDFIVSRTDTEGRIAYGSHIFIELSGYPEEELLGSQHNTLRHPDVPCGVIRPLRGTLATDKAVFADVAASINRQRKIDSCFSACRKSSRSAVDTLGGLYAQMLAMPLGLLVNVLNQQGATYG